MLIAIEPQPEVALIRAAQRGDRAAFGRLYEQYEPVVHGILIARVPYDEAEDLMQDVFIKAMQQLSSLREPGAFCSWLITMARRVAMDFLRSRRSTTDLSAAPEQVSTLATEARQILATIQRLPEAYRETLVLRLVEGMTGPEIAARTGLTPDSVRVNLCRGMKVLRECLKGTRRFDNER